MRNRGSDNRRDFDIGRKRLKKNELRCFTVGLVVVSTSHTMFCFLLLFVFLSVVEAVEQEKKRFYFYYQILVTKKNGQRTNIGMDVT